jgi:hypothetical protein
VPLEHSEPVPGVVSVPNTITVTGAEVGNTILFGAGTRPGVDIVPCTGGSTLVHIKKAKLIGTVVANASGIAEVTATAPARFAGRKVRLQAVEVETCRFTNLVVYTFP